MNIISILTFLSSTNIGKILGVVLQPLEQENGAGSVC